MDRQKFFFLIIKQKKGLLILQNGGLYNQSVLILVVLNSGTLKVLWQYWLLFGITIASVKMKLFKVWYKDMKNSVETLAAYRIHEQFVKETMFRLISSHDLKIALADYLLIWSFKNGPPIYIYTKSVRLRCFIGNNCSCEIWHQCLLHIKLIK